MEVTVEDRFKIVFHDYGIYPLHSMLEVSNQPSECQPMSIFLKMRWLKLSGQITVMSGYTPSEKGGFMVVSRRNPGCLTRFSWPP